MKEQILSMLRGTRGYVSGQELCERLQVSRTAVWKVIGQLKEDGYEIEAVKNRGYRILSSPDIMTEAEIKSRLQTEYMGRFCVCYPETDSTNTRAKQLAEEGKPHGTLVCAERQTGGKGRRGKSWSSPPGESIYMSILLRPEISPNHASMLTLVMGLAAAQACNHVLRDVLGEQTPVVQIKWPNDLLLGGCKIAGILTELSAEVDYINHIVVGIGINVNTEQFPEEIAQMATSLYRATGRKFSRAEIAACCMERFESCYEAFIQTEDLCILQKDYAELLVNTGRLVQVLEPGHEYTGTALGINDRGELLVRREDGSITAVYAGEVSVRGVYGYV